MYRFRHQSHCCKHCCYQELFGERSKLSLGQRVFSTVSWKLFKESKFFRTETIVSVSQKKPPVHPKLLRYCYLIVLENNMIHLVSVSRHRLPYSPKNFSVRLLIYQSYFFLANGSIFAIVTFFLLTSLICFIANKISFSIFF